MKAILICILGTARVYLGSVTALPLLLLAIAAALALAGTVQFYGARSEPSALFTFEAGAMAATPEDVAAALGGPLTVADAATIEQTARLSAG